MRYVLDPSRSREAQPVIFDEGAARDPYRRAAVRLLPARRVHTTGNIRRALPNPDQADLDRIARQAFAAHDSNQHVGFTFQKRIARTWRHHFGSRGPGRLGTARDAGGREAGRRAVPMHPHRGPAQLPLRVPGLLGRPEPQEGGGWVIVVDLSPTGRWPADISALRKSPTQARLHDGGGYLRPVLSTLAAGRVVVTACDGSGGDHELGRRVEWWVCGQPMGLHTGPAWLAWRAGAPLPSRVCSRCFEPGGSMGVAEIDGPLARDRGRGREAALSAGAHLAAHPLSDALTKLPGDSKLSDAFEPGRLLASDPA